MPNFSSHVVFLIFVRALSQRAPNGPNIIFLAIQQEPIISAFTPHTSEETPITPRLAKIARNGIIFDSLYWSIPTSMPSRYCFLLEQDDEVTNEWLSSKLQKLNYRTIGVGQWQHTFEDSHYLPLRHGFQEYFAMIFRDQGHIGNVTMEETLDNMGRPEDVVKYMYWNEEDSRSLQDSIDVYTEVTLSKLKTTYNDNEWPFFLFLPYCEYNTPRGLENSIGALVHSLELSGQWDNTLLLYLSQPGDNCVRIPAFMGGGFVERSLLAAGTAPYRSGLKLRLGDLHSILVNLASRTPQHPGDQWSSLLRKEQDVLEIKQNVESIISPSSSSGEPQKRRLSYSNYEILSTLYGQVGGSRWILRRHWLNESRSLCSWYGVVCSSDEITELSLSANNLVGSLPSQLGLLTSITDVLLLNSNSMNGTLPSQLGQLTKLNSFFYVGVNSFTGSVPSQLGQLTQLNSYFFLGVNSFSGELPSEIGQMSKVTIYFVVSSNQLSGSLPSQLGLLSLMTTNFDMGVNSFSGSLPSQLGQLTGFTSYFQLKDNSLSGSIPSQFGRLSVMIDSFQLNDNNLCGDIPSQLSTLSSQVVTNWDITTGNSLGTDCCLLVGGPCGPSIAPTPSPTPLSEFTILSILYTETLGTNWTNKKNWLQEGEAPCPNGSWYGVTCSSSHINVLSLVGNSLQGNLPTQIGLLTLLNNIFVNSNNLYGSLPSQVGKMSLLTGGMRFNTNSFSGALPSEMGQLTGMARSFYIYANLFSSTLPSELGLLTSMTSTMSLQGNSFSGALPSELGLLSLMIDGFEATGNSFTGFLPSQIGLWSKFAVKFDVSSNMISGSIPSELGQLTLMTALLSMNSNSCSGSLPSQFGRLTSLRSTFSLAFNFMNASLPSELGQLSSLTTLVQLQSNSFSGSIPSELGLWSQFKSYFELQINSFSGPIPSQLGQLTALKSSFYLYSNKLCDDIPSEVTSLSSQVAPGWAIYPNTLLGIQCCAALPSSFVCSPTLAPLTTPTTFHPSYGPTTSTHVPTPTPSLVPTNQPSLVPTLSPTSLPSTPPTALPSSLPTFAPTDSPTSLPTVDCVSGTYFDGVACVDCAAGYYSSFDHAPFPTQCEFCPVGQYNVATKQSECSLCAIGKLSSTDRTYCRDCEAGEYNFNNTACVECGFGKYAPQALTDSCLVCPNGSHTNNQTKATTCTSCDSGKYSTAASYECSDCPKGTYSSSGALSCSPCPVGFYAASTASSTCTACAAGTASDAVGSTVCDACPTGQYQGSTGQENCVDCEAGKYSDATSSSTCSSCSAAYSSKSGSNGCNLAAVGYFLKESWKGTSSSTSCPNNAQCRGGTLMPVPSDGYWVDRSKHKFASVIYKCPRNTCLENAPNSSCWDVSRFNQSLVSHEEDEDLECDSSSLQCSEGANGPLCGSCIDGYLLEAVSSACELCKTAKPHSYIAVGVIMFIAVLLFIYFATGDKYQVKSVPLIRYLLNFEHGSLKVLWVSYQIIVSASYSVGTQVNRYGFQLPMFSQLFRYPPPFSTMLRYLKLFSFDFLALKCYTSGYDAYYTSVYLWCIIPIFLAILFVLVGIVRISQIKRLKGESSENITLIRNQHIWALLILSYAVLPNVSNKQLQTFDCITVNNEQYLRADTAINCRSDDYLAFQVLILVLMAIYQLIPVLWFVLLYRRKHDLNPSTSNYDNRLALFIRDHNPKLTSLRFLFIDYKCSKWWFEIADMYRRIIFIGIVPLVSSNSATRASFGCILSIFSVAYYREEQPYRVEFTNVISHIAQFSILVTYYGALTIETDSMINFGLVNENLGIFLMLLNFVIFVLALWLAYKAYRAQWKQTALKEFKALSNEDARSFSASKFTTTFDVLWQSSIPSSHTLVFHYTSQQDAVKARKSGIPTRGNFNGIPLSLRYPHVTVDNDFAVFCPPAALISSSEHGNNSTSSTSSSPRPSFNLKFPNEEVLVLSLPKQILDPLTDYDDDDGLCMISTKVLNAMRPTSFAGVVDSTPWVEGVILLSPQCIVRSFRLVDRLDAQPYTPNTFSRSSTRMKNGSAEQHDHHDVLIDVVQTKQALLRPISLEPIHKYIKAMSKIRQRAFEQKMSTQGQGDGGVYFSTQGPASYGLGTDDYEINIIKDCFGVERVDEYKGQGKLDVVLIYGCEASVLQQAPGGRKHALMVSKSTFRDLSLEHNDRNYFLRPDRILGVFYVNPRHPPQLTQALVKELIVEANRENQCFERVDQARIRHLENSSRVEPMVKAIWASVLKAKVADKIRRGTVIQRETNGVSERDTTSLSDSSMTRHRQASDIEMSSISSYGGGRLETNFDQVNLNPLVQTDVNTFL